MMEENRVRFARVRAPQQNEVRILHLLIRTGGPARSENRRQTGDAWRVSSSVAAINVVAAHHCAHKLLRHVVQFVCRFRTTEHPYGTRSVLPDLLLQPGNYAIERFLPACGTVSLSFAYQWSG